MKLFLLANLVSFLLVLAVVQVHGFAPFNFESEFPQDSKASKISYESQYFPKSNDEETSLFPEFEPPYDSLEVQNFPEKTSQFSESGFSQESDYPDESFDNEQVPYEIDAVSEIKLHPPSPAPSPSNPEYACKCTSSTECRKENFPLLLNLCNQVCKTRCLLRYSGLIYDCTTRCAEFMPKLFKSDKKKADEYMNYCYKKCIKKP
ncbi:hypothetical protein HRI_003871600 [Hibiscus trionum]|uniref:Uncharacterized protein n=1 Tax=Hibiscus trionum TaxID=183268 RepID=A0A9W7IY32_HIBTR|nr:hypothetical protein HRI_003871600 [Hibiscus trionum]